MKLDFLVQAAGLKLLCGEIDRTVNGAYAGDLLSWVMSHAKADNIWVTIMSNINVVAVASLTEVACVVLAEGVLPDDGVLEAAKEKGITMLSSGDTVYSICRSLALAGLT